MKRSRQTSLTAKGNDEVVDLDKQLEAAGFTLVQKEYVAKITELYPLTESNSTASDDETVKKIKLGLLDIENEIALESRLDDTQKHQMFTYIGMQYATLDSIINYVEKAVGTSSTGKWKISLRKIINIVITVVVWTAVGAVLGTPMGPVGVIAGAAVLGGVAVNESLKNNTCIKICGIGYCNTSFFSCK